MSWACGEDVVLNGVLEGVNGLAGLADWADGFFFWLVEIMIMAILVEPVSLCWVIPNWMRDL